MKSLILISRDAPEEAARALSERGEILRLPPDPALPAPVASHPDMIAVVCGPRVVAAREYLDTYPDVARAISAGPGVRVIPDDGERGPVYPLDVGLNCLVIGDFLFCGKQSASPGVLRLAGELGLTVVPVNQGYAACSALAAGDAVVTADPSVADAAERAGLAVLRISPGGIELPGYDAGFIGGASGVIGDTVFFFGDPSTHPDGDRIAAFLAARGFRSAPLRPGPLLNLGGIKAISRTGRRRAPR